MRTRPPGLLCITIIMFHEGYNMTSHLSHKLIYLIIGTIFLLGIFGWMNRGKFLPQEKDSDELEPQAEQQATSEEMRNLPSDGSVLPGNVLIADRGNNRLIEVTPDKKIVWELHFTDLYPGLKPGFGADDAFFTPGGKSVIVNLEEFHTLAEIAYPSKQLLWEYGHGGQPGSQPGYLNTPDDAYRWPDGLTSVADIRNCRILFLNQQKEIVRQFGQVGRCIDRPGFYDKPNGDTPLPNGDVLVSIINGQKVAEVRPDGSEVFRIKVPVAYPSDAQKLANGDILVADYSEHGKVVEVTTDGQVIWEYFFPNDPQRNLNHPSLAIQLPNKDILLNDDGNHRVIVIDYVTKKIVWQYGVTGKAGSRPGQLNIPDGVDIHYGAAQNVPITPKLSLDVPFDVHMLPPLPRSFGFYPFGLKSAEHPEGHAGFNVEIPQSVPITAPADMQIVSVTSPAGRSDEHNLLAQAGVYQLEFLRIGKIVDTVKVGAQLHRGDVIGWGGYNRTLKTTMFHIGVLNSNDEAICPDQQFWSEDAWMQLQQLLHTSKDDNGRPYNNVCYSTQPIARSVRVME